MSLYYPAYLNLVGRLCVVVGGGEVGARRVAGLLAAQARVRVVSPALLSLLQQQADAKEIEAILSPYETAHLEGAFLVCAATNDRETNARIARDAKERGVLVNVADAPEEGDFIVPAALRRGDFCLSFATGGNQPALTARLKREFETQFPPEYGALVALMGEMRDRILTQIPSAQRRAAFARLLDSKSELLLLLSQGRDAEARALAENFLLLSQEPSLPPYEAKG